MVFMKLQMQENRLYEIINEIISRDRVLGKLAQESFECFQDNKIMAALSCLFLLSEHVVKFAIGLLNGDFKTVIETAKSRGVISDEEYEILDSLRMIRNRLFHENHYAYVLSIDDVDHSFDEESTKELLYRSFAEKVFQISLKLVRN